jgi:hypothetical protein
MKRGAGLNNGYIGTDKRAVVDGFFTLEKHYIQNPSPTFLLDSFDLTGLVGAFSTRRLLTSYNGSANTIIRSSDSTTQNIGFVGEDYNSSALNSFVGSNSGFFHTWFNQATGGSNLVQTTNANRPRIRNAGTNETIGSRIAARFVASSNMFMDLASIGSGSAATALVVFSATSATPSGYDGPLLGNFSSDTSQGQHWPFADGNIYDNFCHSSRSSASVSSWGITSPTIVTIVSQASSYKLWQNSNLRINTASGSTTIRTASGHRIGRTDSPGGTGYFDGKACEIILFKRALSDTELSAYRTRAAAYFGVTL